MSVPRVALPITRKWAPVGARKVPARERGQAQQASQVPRISTNTNKDFTKAHVELRRSEMCHIPSLVTHMIRKLTAHRLSAERLLIAIPNLLLYFQQKLYTTLPCSGLVSQLPTKF